MLRTVVSNSRPYSWGLDKFNVYLSLFMFLTSNCSKPVFHIHDDPLTLNNENKLIMQTKQKLGTQENKTVQTREQW